MAGGPLQTIDDYARILSNGFTFGGADKLVHAITGNDEAAQTAAARQRQGFGGDLADAATMLAGGGAVLKGVTKIPALIRAAPQIAEAVPAAARAARVGLADLGGMAPTKAEVAARLGIDYVPTLAERAIGAVGSAAGKAAAYPFRHPVLAGLAALGGLGEYAARNDSGGGSKGPRVTSAAKAAPAPSASSSNSGNFSPEPMPQAPPQHSNPDFSALASMVAKGNGGKISVRELSALADIAAKTSPRQAPAKPPTPAEIAAQRALQLGEPYYQSKIKSATSQEEADDAYQKTLEFYKELAKARPYDPASSMGYGFPGDDN